MLVTLWLLVGVVVVVRQAVVVVALAVIEQAQHLLIQRFHTR
jgi:hypothetical protein